jgi:cob(I)alamin adenosyltransferase
VRKDDARLECFGAVDELNAAIGLAAVSADEEIATQLRQIQHELFSIGAHLATPPESAHTARLPGIDERMVARLEQEIDRAESELQPLRQFILPGGSEPAARLHLARTICRRAERRLVTLTADPPLPDLALAARYLNRLSDWCFVMARLANNRKGVPDVAWEK